jgi:hypothetical protein
MAQEDFSANVVKQGPEKQNSGPTKIYVTKTKMRFESSQPGNRGGAVIVNLSTQTADILMPERKMYMESAQSQVPGSQRKWAFFRTMDPENACPDWLKMQTQQNKTCEKVGHETVNGRNTVKYTGTSANGDSGTVWVDPKLAFPIKWESKNDSWQLQDINEGSQPASLFEIPSDYQKFQMPAGMANMPHPQ